MLAIMPVLNQQQQNIFTNTVAMAQGYATIIIEIIIIIANIQPTKRNMNVEQVNLKASLLVQ